MDEEYTEGGIGARIGGMFKRGVTGVVNGTKSAKVRMDITSLNGRKADACTEIGKKVYALYESGLVRNAELLDLCSEVREIDRDIAEKERYLAAMRPEEYEGGAMPPAPYEGGIEDYPQT